MRRIKLLLAVVAAMSMSMLVSAPAMADHLDFEEHDLFIDEYFVELDDCELIFIEGDEAVYVCEVDFD